MSFLSRLLLAALITPVESALSQATAAAPAPAPAAAAAVALADASARAGDVILTIGDDEGRALAGAQVTIGGKTVASDAAGRVRLSALAAGRHVVRVRALGHRPVERQLVVSAGGLTRLSIVLERVPLVLTTSVVTATRSESKLSDIPGAVSVVGRGEVETQGAVSNSIGAMLGKTLPGLGVGTGTPSLSGQPLRGREASVLIDGVPLSTARNVGRDLVTIDPAMVERVEVLRGASAIYGDGATGGIINIITRRTGEPSPLRWHTDVRTTASGSAPGEGGGIRVAQSATGKRGILDYSVGGSLDRIGGYYDADGDRIPSDPNGQGGLNDTDAYDGFVKLGLSARAQRLQVTLNHFDATQHTRFATAPAADTVSKARVISGMQLSTPQNHVNSMASLDYTHDGVRPVANSRVHLQGYGRDYFTRFAPFARKLVRPSTGSTTAKEYQLQSFVDSWKLGGRLEIETPLPLRDASVTWGADLARERTFQGLNQFDLAQYKASGGLVYDKVDEWFWVPPMRVENLGFFAQGAWRPLDRVMLRGGLRHERDALSVGDFSTIEEVAVEGGRLTYRPTVFNAGIVVKAARPLDLFTNFSQGFSLGDMGRILRAATPGFVVGSRSTDAMRVDQWEYGARGLWSRAQATVSYFRSASELGTLIDTSFQVLRAPERIHGVELTLDVQPSAAWELGGSFTWNDGDFLDPRDDEWKALNGFRISPPKGTAYVEYQAVPALRNRLQLVTIGSRDRAWLDQIGYGSRKVSGFTTLDYTGTLRLPRGTVTLGVENALNAFYYTLPSQLMSSGRFEAHAAARGRVVTVGYAIGW